MELITASNDTHSKNLVFTSAGDHSRLRDWLEGKRDFDLWVVYYGDTPGTFCDLSDKYLSRKGSKFQNLHHCFQNFREEFDRYAAIMVLDDDIIIDASGLTRLFAIREQLDLWVLQPAFRIVGKISWDITRVRPTSKLRFTNFVENACPLFRRDKLEAFLHVYDPALVAYGTDWWFLQSMGKDLENHVAIVDEVACVNPYDRSKGGTREIDRLQSTAQRHEVWRQMKALHGLDEMGRRQVEFRRIKRSILAAAIALICHIPDWMYYYARYWLGRSCRSAGRPDREATAKPQRRRRRLARF
jgi:hypothetical protein